MSAYLGLSSFSLYLQYNLVENTDVKQAIAQHCAATWYNDEMMDN